MKIDTSTGSRGYSNYGAGNCRPIDPDVFGRVQRSHLVNINEQGDIPLVSRNTSVVKMRRGTEIP